jgi:hypothetical protein
MAKRVAILVLLASVVAGAQAVSFSSFQGAEINGVTVLNTSGLTYEIRLDPGATLTFGGNTYGITQLFGFWSLHADDGVNTLGGTGTDQSNWEFGYSGAGTGEIAGWDGNANAVRLLPGDSKTLTYTSLNQSAIDGFGFHLQYGTAGTTAFFKGATSGVPGPLAIAPFLGGLIVALRRRRL